MIKYNGINHLAMATGDMDRTIRFWRDLLGMRLVAGLGKPGHRHYFFQISENDLIAFFEWPHVEPVEEKDHGRPVDGPFIFDHVSFGVETEDDLWELYDKLTAAGFWVSEVIDHGFIHSIYAFDPNLMSPEKGLNPASMSGPGWKNLRPWRTEKFTQAQELNWSMEKRQPGSREMRKGSLHCDMSPSGLLDAGC
jgi:catechol 2,3-dioxygenase-like lactoylglutathione lyase family enzyme